MPGYRVLVYNELDEEGHTDGSETERMVDSSFPKMRRAAWLGIGVLAVVACALAVYSAHTKASSTSQKHQQLFDAKISAEPAFVIDFMTSRSLAQVGGTSLDIKCPSDQPVCNPAVVFAVQMRKSLELLQKIAPDMFTILKENKLTKVQQEIILGALPLLHNKKVLELGQTIAKVVKRWAKSGDKVVHEKVQEALQKFLQERGTEGLPEMDLSQPTIGNSSMWTPLMHPKFLAQIHDEGNETVARQLYAAIPTVKPFSPTINDEKVTGDDVFGAIGGWLLPFVFFVLEVLHYEDVIQLPKMMRVLWIWPYGILGAIGCVTVVACPFIFLDYWLNAWLLFGRKPSEMKGIPWDFMLKHLPGLDGSSRLLASAADARMAA